MSDGVAIVVPAALEFSDTVASTTIPVGEGATRESGNIAELLPSVALICAVVLEVTLEVATWKLPVLLDPAIESVVGTMTLELLAPIDTDVPPLGAAELSVT